ncbi:MAG: DUF6985 domain-containing protein [Paenalcaligenes sp.]
MLVAKWGKGMDIPGLGVVEKDDSTDWYFSDPIAIPVLGGQECEVVLEEYDEDECQADFHTAIANFLTASPKILREADDALFSYYKDYEKYWLEEGNAPLATAEELWQRVRFGSELMVSRSAHGDKAVYVSLECGCDWEVEHGLQLVFKHGLTLTKLGPFDGHLSNANAYADDSLEQVIYCSRC